MKARGTLAALLPPLALLVALLGACGGDSESTAADPDPADSPSATATLSEGETTQASESEPPVPDWPACEAVWVADADLPHGYKGCLEGDDPVEADRLSCSSGQRLVRYADRFFAVAGGRIYETAGPLDKDKEYLETIRTCRG